MYKEIILSKIFDYLKLKKMEYRGRIPGIITFHCPFCDKAGTSATIMPNSSNVMCGACGGRKYNLIDLAKKVENLPDATDEEVLTHLRNLLNLTVTTEKDQVDIEKQLNTFAGYKWALVPCAKNDKRPIQKEWQLKENRDKAEWFHWINSGLNIGVRTGKVSNLTVIDFDFFSKEEKVELVKEETSKKRKEELLAKKVIPVSVASILGETLIQETLGGFHLFYQATDLPKGDTSIEGVHVDIENEGGQVVIPPSLQVGVYEEYKENNEVKKRVVGYGHRRFINDKPIAVMPDALYAMLKKSEVKAPAKTKSEIDHEEVSKAIASEDFKIKDLQNNRNNTLLKLGGILQKKMNISQVSNVLDILNHHLLDDPIPETELMSIVENLEKYIDVNEWELTRNILDYLKETDIATKGEIEYAIFGQRTTSENKKRLDRILANLIIDHKIIKQNSRNYKIVRDMQWTDNILNVGTQIGFKMPYFQDYAYFNKGDLILIGAQTKVGKTTLAMNIAKRLVDQGIKPRYLYNESGGRFAKTAVALGLKDGDLEKARATNPLEVILKPNCVYIYDWIRPVDFAKTADIFDSLVNKLEETNSVMIGFVQLTDKNDWFATNLIRQFVALSVKYNYMDKDGINTAFELSDVRDRKTSGKAYKIPCKYFEETREVKTIEELDMEERKKADQEFKAKEEQKNDTPV